MRRLVTIAAALVGLALLLPMIAAAEPVKIALPVNSLESMPIYIAQDKGLFKKHGVEIDVITSREEAELALESGPPSGRVSLEHVVNVLGRLNAAPVPGTIHTALQVLEPPLANTARYDTLRALDSALEGGHDA